MIRKFSSCLHRSIFYEIVQFQMYNDERWPWLYYNICIYDHTIICSNYRIAGSANIKPVVFNYYLVLLTVSSERKTHQSKMSRKSLQIVLRRKNPVNNFIKLFFFINDKNHIMVGIIGTIPKLNRQ